VKKNFSTEEKRRKLPGKKDQLDFNSGLRGSKMEKGLCARGSEGGRVKKGEKKKRRMRQTIERKKERKRKKQAGKSIFDTHGSH